MIIKREFEAKMYIGIVEFEAKMFIGIVEFEAKMYIGIVVIPLIKLLKLLICHIKNHSHIS